MLVNTVHIRFLKYLDIIYVLGSFICGTDSLIPYQQVAKVVLSTQTMQQDLMFWAKALCQALNYSKHWTLLYRLGHEQNFCCFLLLLSTTYTDHVLKFLLGYKPGTSVGTFWGNKML
jgi:hypothetical protein